MIPIPQFVIEFGFSTTYSRYIVTGFTIYLPKAKNTLYALYFTHFNPLNWPPIANIDDGGSGDGGRGGYNRNNIRKWIYVNGERRVSGSLK